LWYNTVLKAAPFRKCGMERLLVPFPCFVALFCLFLNILNFFADHFFGNLQGFFQPFIDYSFPVA